MSRDKYNGLLTAVIPYERALAYLSQRIAAYLSHFLIEW